MGTLSMVLGKWSPLSGLLGFCNHYFVFFVPEAFILHDGLILFCQASSVVESFGLLSSSGSCLPLLILIFILAS